MRNLIRSAVLALGLLPALACAQTPSFPQTLPPNTLIGRLAFNAGPIQAIPFLTFVNNLPLASGKVFIGSAGNFAVAQALSGDCAVSLTGVITCTQSAGNFTVIGNLTVGGSVIGSGILATNIAAPATPAAGTTRIYVDSTTKTPTGKNDAGALSNMVMPTTCSANQWVNAIASNSIVSCAQPALGNISGFGANVAAFLAAASSANLRAAMTDETGTGLAYFQGGDIGTPSAGVGTNFTGTAAGLTAGHVTTNANLTGDTTSVGNATTTTKINGVDQTVPWTIYAPIITSQSGTITTVGATSGRYRQVAKTIILQVDTVITTAGTGAGFLQATLPFTAAAFNYVGAAREVLLTGKSGSALISPSGTVVKANDATATTFIANGNQVVFGITYEIP